MKEGACTTMTPEQVKGFIKAIGRAVNVVYGTTTICMHNGKLVEVSPQGEWVVIKHMTCPGKKKLKEEFLGFYLKQKPTSGVTTKPIAHWHTLLNMHRTPIFSPRFDGPGRKGSIRFGDFFGVLYIDPQGKTDCNNGRFLYAIHKDGRVLSRVSPKDKDFIKWVYYIHWNWSPGAPLVSMACLQQGTEYQKYWIPEMTRKGITILDIQKG